MNRHLDKYLAYIKELRKERRQCTSLDAFSQRIKEPALRLLRMEARIELQAIYELIRNNFQLPYIDVYLLARKKISIAGWAFHSKGMPEQIRIFHIYGCAVKPRHLWILTDLTFATEEVIFETFIHECAHVLAIWYNGHTEHEKPFVEAYEDVEIYLKASGYDNLINPDLRLSGVPPESYANKVRLGSYIVPKMHREDYSLSF
jgi:hypothetical protein